MNARHLENFEGKSRFVTNNTKVSTKQRLPSYEKIKPMLLEIICLLLFLFFRSSPFLIIPRTIAGIFSLLLLPGYFLARIFNPSSDPVEIWALSPFFGMLCQLLLVYLIFVFSPLFNGLKFLWMILLTPLVSIVVFQMKYGREVTHTRIESRRTSLSGFIWLSILTVLGLTLRIIYQRISTNPHTDTSLFCEMARNLVEMGKFTSKVIIIQKPSYFRQGFNPHIFTYFSYAIFFSIGGVSYSSVKLATIYYGMTAIFMTYLFTRKFYGNEIAKIALLLTVFHPIILFFSSIPINGSEIVGITFLFSTIYFFLISLVKENSSKKYAVIAGLSAFATLASRAEYFYIYVLCAPFLLLSLNNAKQGFLRFILFCLTLYPSLLLRFCDFMTIPSNYLHLSIPSGILALYLLLGLSKKVDKGTISPVIFNIIIASLMMLSLPKLYLLLRSQTPLPNILIKREEEVVPELLRRTLLLSGNLKAFFSRFRVLWYTAILKLSYPISVLSFFSLVYLRKFRCNLFLTIYALVFSTIFSLTQVPIGGIDHHRFLLAIFFILIILSAQTIKIALDSFRRYINRGPCIRFYVFFELSSKNWRFSTRKINLGIMTTMLVLTLIFSILLYPLYFSEVYVVRSTDIKVAYRYDEGIKWVIQNTKPDSVLMTYKPYEWAWYTNRTSLMPWPLYLNLTQLNELIRLFKVNYLILDEAFYYSYSDKEIRSLYLGTMPKCVFVRVFNSSTEPHVVIYNVTSVWSDKPP